LTGTELEIFTDITGNQMQITKFTKNFWSFAGIILSLLICLSCERTDYEIMDPATTGTWTLFDTSDGLPGNAVTGIQLDSRDNLWFTFESQGIARFSQGIWTSYKISDSPLLSNTVNCLAELSDGKIIFGTSEGLSVLSETNVWNSLLDTITSTRVKVIKETSDGSVWVGTSNRGLFVNHGTGFTNPLAVLFPKINTIEEDKNGNIWIGTDSGVIRWNGSSFTFLVSNIDLPVSVNKVNSLRRDSKKRLWIGTWGSKKVTWVDDNGFHDLSLLTGKDSCFINDIFEDRRGNIWFATTGDGVICYDGIVPKKYSTGNMFPENTVRAIGEDKSGNIWFGLGSKGVVRYTLPIN
jgi:ligand-binding sensor domain-containing protein